MIPLVILGFDALEYSLVEEFNFPSLKQHAYGKTDISMFSQPRTVVIWSSFLAGKSTEEDVLKQKDMWSFKLQPEETFFAGFERWKAIDVPGFTYDTEMHKKEREAMKAFFNKEISVEEYDKIAFDNHKKIKEQFFSSLNEDLDILMAYFSLADVIGHVSFGIRLKMKMIYYELAKIAEEAKKKAEKLLIISDHGMYAVGRYGDHSPYGFWSFSEQVELKEPKITDFKDFILKLR